MKNIINSVAEMPQNGLFVIHSDHYKANKAHDFIIMEDGKAYDLMGNFRQLKDHQYMEDRGVVKINHILPQLSTIMAYIKVKQACKAYINAYDNVKNFKPDTLKFEQTNWFKNRANKVKPGFLEKKRSDFYSLQKTLNHANLNNLDSVKFMAIGELNILGIPLVLAYDEFKY